MHARLSRGRVLETIAGASVTFGPIGLELRMAGIGDAVLFADLDGIAQNVTVRYQCPHDELHARLAWAMPPDRVHA